MWVTKDSWRIKLSCEFDYYLFWSYDFKFNCSYIFTYEYRDEILMNYNLVYRYFKSMSRFEYIGETNRKYFICG